MQFIEYILISLFVTPAFDFQMNGAFGSFNFLTYQGNKFTKMASKQDLILLILCLKIWNPKKSNLLKFSYEQNKGKMYIYIYITS